MIALNLSTAVAALAIANGLFLLVGVIRRLVFSPLRNVPGPKIAAATGIWLWLEDMRGTAPGSIKALHAKYGNIVRIGPQEVSINDVAVHNDVLYCQAPKFMKAGYFYDPFKTGPSGMFQSSEPKEHSSLRRLASKAFSRRSILQYEPQIHQTLELLSSILSTKASTNTAFDLSKMSRCLSLDFICKFTYGQTLEALKVPDFNETILEAFDSFAFMMLPSLRAASIAFLSMLPSKTFQAIPNMRESVRKALELYNHGQENKQDTTFQPLLQSEQDAAEKLGAPLSKDFLIADGVADIFAGTDTTSTTLTMTLLAIFASKPIYDKLHEELKTIMPDQYTIPSLPQFEALPYLSACVKEGLRYSTPVRSRLPRVTPAAGYSYQGHFIPAGTLISSSPHLMDYNEEIFPNPHDFVPDRWISDDAAKLKRLEGGFAAFSKGSRGCIGINLAMAEIYLTIGVLTRRFRPFGQPKTDIKTREIFGVIFGEAVTIRLDEAQD